MDQNDKPITELLRDLVNQLSAMFRHELDLARAEMGEKASQARSGAMLLAMAAMLGLGALVILLLAAVAALSLVLDVWLSALIVGLVAAIVAAVMASKGSSNLKAQNLMPNRTIQSVRDDARFAKEKVR